MENRKIFVAGTGKSGIAAAKLILDMGGEVLLYDSKEDIDRGAILAGFAPGSKIDMITGKLYSSQVRGTGLAILSPGIPLSAEFVRVLRSEGVPLLGELEIAYQASRGKLCAITGTNGKTTTTALTGHILKHHYKDVHIVGNIGNPFASEALNTTDASCTVVEVSSFMLETILEFHPFVSAILNITPDHLDRHLTMDNYIEAKKAITRNQTEEDFVVLNYDDPVLRKFGESKELKPHVVWFSSKERPPEGLFCEDGCIFLKEKGTTTQILEVNDLQLLGRHNYENVMAACGMTLRLGVPVKTVIEACKSFHAVEHRIEFVRERCKVRYYNDSKGTNPDAAIQALNSMPGQTLLIAGGYDKHSEYDEWVRLFPGKVKRLILLGQTRDDIAKCCKKYGFDSITYVDDMDEAVRTCSSYADEGDYVLLSPACASWGMFKNFEERGRIFKDCVNRL